MPPARPAAALLGLLLLVGCSSSSNAASTGPRVPAESEFQAGTCASLAPDVIAVGKAIGRLGTGKVVGRDVKVSLRDAQDRIFAVTEAAEPTLKPALDDLVVKIGIVRIRADGNEYDASLGASLTKAYDQVVNVCTSPAPSPS